MIAFCRGLARDFRYAVRSLGRSPLFTTVALVTLAITGGALASAFSVVNGVLLKPLPYPHPDQLIALTHVAPGANLPDEDHKLLLSASMFLTYAEHNRSFQSLGIWGRGPATITGLAEPEEVRSAIVSGRLLQTLGVAPLLGRWLNNKDEAPSPNPAVMLTYGYWQRRFGGDPTVLGRTLTINSGSSEIVGVMPAGFRIANDSFDVILPLQFDRDQLNVAGFAFEGIARLQPTVTLAQAGADITRMLPIWLESWPSPQGVNPRAYLDVWRVAPALTTLQDEVVGNVGGMLWIVAATIGVVLVIACANIINLLLVRASARERELAVRAALGAGASHIRRTFLFESTTLALLGGLLGLGVAYGALAVLRAIGPTGLPRLHEISIGPRVLLFALAISLLIGAVLGVIPAMAHSGRSIPNRLDGRGTSPGRGRLRAQSVLAVAQVALAFVLLVGSGLMIRTFQALRHVDPGLTDATSIQTLRILIPFRLGPERVLQIETDILDALNAIPGVTSAALLSSLPMDGGYRPFDGIAPENLLRQPNNATVPFPVFKYVSPGAFETLGTRLIAGRDLTWTDIYQRRQVLLISESLARSFWGDPAAAIGQRTRTGGRGSSPSKEVIGVVQDVHDTGLEAPAPGIVYQPFYRPAVGEQSAFYQPSVAIAIRSPLAGSPGLLRQAEQAIWSVDANLPLTSVRTMQDVANQSLARTSFALVMIVAAGVVALALGVIGLYGVLSYAVSQRRREIAIRVAVGAEQRKIEQTFLGYGACIAMTGIVIGIVVAAGVTRLISSLLFDVQALDAPTFVAVAILLSLVTVLASYLPARRASTIDPAATLSNG